MAVHRKAPICFLCGESYKGIYNHRENFVGDTFVRWDKDSHQCNRDGLLYFIERSDTHEWYRYLGTWTKDPLQAQFFRSPEQARAHTNELINRGAIPGKGNAPEYLITEHIFQ